MNYDEMFEFEKIDGGYALTSYLKKDDKNIHKVEIPSEYHGEPVTAIGERAFEYAAYLEEVNIPPEVKTIGKSAFSYCYGLSGIVFSEGLLSIGEGAFGVCEDYLASVTLPKSLERIGNCAFDSCWCLEKVTFLNPSTVIGENIFYSCPNLPAETQLIGILRSCDITQSIPESEYIQWEKGRRLDETIALISYPILCEDVFALAVKNNCFRSVKWCDKLVNLLEVIINFGWMDHLRIAADGGLLDDRELLDKLTDISVQKGDTELTAWLLEHKNKNIGFSGNNYEQ